MGYALTNNCIKWEVNQPTTLSAIRKTDFGYFRIVDFEQGKGEVISKYKKSSLLSQRNFKVKGYESFLAILYKGNDTIVNNIHFQSTRDRALYDLNLLSNDVKTTYKCQDMAIELPGDSVIWRFFSSTALAKSADSRDLYGIITNTIDTIFVTNKRGLKGVKGWDNYVFGAVFSLKGKDLAAFQNEGKKKAVWIYGAIDELYHKVIGTYVVTTFALDIKILRDAMLSAW